MSIFSGDTPYFRNNMLHEIMSRPIENQAIIGNEYIKIQQESVLGMSRALKNIKRKLVHVQELSESPGRVGEYILTLERLKKKRPDMTYKQMIDRSLFESRHLMDFTQSGLVGQAVNQHSAFFNASLRGTAKIGEAWFSSWGKTGKTALYTFTTLVLPSILNWHRNHNDPAYKVEPQWKKDMFWLYAIRDENGKTILFIPIPKPWEPGLIFATGTERFLDWYYAEDQETLDEWIWEVVWTYVRNTLPRVLGFGAAPLQVAADWNINTDTPLFSGGMEGGSPYMKYNSNTTALARVISEGIESLRPALEVLKVEFLINDMTSPIALDFYASNAFGPAWQKMLEYVELALQKAGIIVDVPGPKYSKWVDEFMDTQLVRAFIITTKHIPKGGQPMTDMHESYKKYSRIYIDYKNAEKMDNKKLMEKIEKKPNFEMAKELDAFMTSNIWPLYAAIKKIEFLPESELSGASKRQQLDLLLEDLLDLAITFNLIVKTHENPKENPKESFKIFE